MGGSSGSVNTSSLGPKPQEGQQLDFATLRGQGEDTFQRLANTLGNNTYAQGAWQASEESRQRADRLAQMAEEMSGVADAGAAGVSRYADPTDRASLAAQQAVDAAAGRVEGSAGALGSLAGRINYDPTAIEAELERQAIGDLSLGRTLTPEEQRDAQQSARAAFSARGLGTSMGSSAAEILNRDRFASARQDQRRQFAQGVNAANQDARLARLGLGGQLFGQQGNLFSTGGQLRGDAGRIRLAGLGQSADIMTNAGNMRMQGRAQAANTMDAAGRLALANSQNINAISPYTQALQGGGYSQGLGLAGNTASFNTNMLETRRNSWMNNNAAMQGASMQAGAMRDAGMMGMFGEIGGSIFSDKRMKTDIKPVGKAGNVLGLTAYEFRYKGDKEKHVGFMAQDVKKVLPEAVEEVEHKGKKRLTIKPVVIGAAIAEQLSQAKAA